MSRDNRPSPKQQSPKPRSAARLLGALAAALLSTSVLGCGDEPDKTQGAGITGGSYAVSSSVFSPSGDTTTYLALVPSLDEAQVIDYTKSLELGGGAFVYPIEGDAPKGALFVGALEEPTIQRFDVAAEGKLVPGAKLSLSNQGVTDATFEGVVFVSEVEAWYVDASQQQVIVWNPKEMTVTSSFKVPELSRPGWDLGLGRLRPFGAGRLIAPLAWYRWKDNEAMPMGAAAIFDVAGRRLVKIIEDSRCPGLENAVTAANGDVYFGPGLYYPMIKRFVTPSLPSSCVLRVRKGEESFDPTFVLNLEKAAGGRPAGFLLMASDGAFWTQAWYETRYATPPTWADRRNVEAWRWWRVSMDGTVATEEPSLTFSGGAAQAFVTDGRALTSQVTADYASAVLFDMNASGGPKRGLTVKGGLYGVARVR
jgi:hypothetical protein